MKTILVINIFVSLLSINIRAQVFNNDLTNAKEENKLAYESVGGKYVRLEFTQQIGNKVFFKTGLHYSVKSIQKDFHNEINDIHVPVLFGYELYKNEKVKLNPSIGLCFKSRASYGSAQNKRNENPAHASGSENIAMSCNFGVKYRLTKNITIEF